ncbi:MAG: hypothetical protein MI923_23045 [Phycisphaerales bacterium]|nr:hypothetical protein [Phycisphaerales bacterium]
MTEHNIGFTRLRQILLSTSQKPHLAALKRMVRNWRQPGAGQDAINRAMIRAMDEIQERLDALLKV